MRVYIVQQGDTLWKIAKQHHVNFEQLKQMNNQLTNLDLLMPGMEILLPEEDSSGSNVLGQKQQVPTPLPAPNRPSQPEPMPPMPPMQQMPQPPMMEPMPCFICQMMPWPMPMPWPPMQPWQQSPMPPMQPWPQQPQMPPMQPWPQQPQMQPWPPMQPIEPQSCWPEAGCGGDPNVDRQYYDQIRSLEQQVSPMPPHHPAPYW